MKKILILFSLAVFCLISVGCTTGKAYYGSNLVFISPDDLSQNYGTSNVVGITGSQICNDFGYSGCVTSFGRSQVTYFQSKDGQCKGTQSFEESNPLLGCEHSGLRYICAQSFNAGGITAQEPYYGDQGQIILIEGVFCEN